MKNKWLAGVICLCVIVTVIIAFNSRGKHSEVSLSDIFPEEEVIPIDVAYEFEKKDANTETKVENKEVENATDQAVANATTVAKAEEEKPTEQKAERTKYIPLDAKFAVQVASFRDRKRAEQILTKLNALELPGYIEKKDLGNSGTWYRVYVGRYQDKKEAQEVLIKVKKDYSDSFIRTSSK